MKNKKAITAQPLPQISVDGKIMTQQDLDNDAEIMERLKAALTRQNDEEHCRWQESQDLCNEFAE